MHKALIYGVTGQDGSYLSELLLEKGYEVVGVARRVSTTNTQRISHLLEIKDFTLVEGDITDSGSVNRTISRESPDEIYNLAAQSHVATSFEQPKLTMDINAGGVLNILEALRAQTKKIRFYQASSSEMFGDNYTIKHSLSIRRGDLSKPESKQFQNENTPFNPKSPYAVSKLAAHQLVKLYRESYDLHASCGILFNHESPRRGDNFVTKKITNYVRYLDNYLTMYICQSDVKLVSKDFKYLELGNLDASRDWGHAKDYVEAMWMMLQQNQPGDYVVATGETHTVREFLDEAFKCIRITNWEPYVQINPKFYRPNEVPCLCGDPSKVMKELGWQSNYNFNRLVQDMVND